MATVAVHSLEEGPECVVTPGNFRSWKRKLGRNTAFVVQMPNADAGVLICTFADMNKLPPGDYRAQLVRKCAIPAAAQKELRGTDLWKCA